MKIKCSVNFYLEKRKLKGTADLINENVPIYLFFSFDGKRFSYYTGYRIDRDKWQEEEQKVKRNNFNKAGVSSSEINDYLDRIRAEVTDIYKECKALKKNPTAAKIREELKKRIDDNGNTNVNTFFDLYEQFVKVESQAKTWTISTVKKFNTNIAHLKRFQKEKKYTVDFDSIDDNFFNKYIAFQRETLKHRNTTIAKNFKILKWYLNWATKKGYNENLNFREYSVEMKGTKRSQKIVFLTWEELMNLYTFPVAKKYLEQVRDVFCFCCFTGLRYSDVYNLKRNNIKKDTIEITTVKTDDDLTIDLNDYSRAILDKYKDVPFKNDKCLPVISNQKTNEYLKELGQLVGLNDTELEVFYMGSERIEKTYPKWKLLTTHVGRKTFVTNALFLNIPSEVVMQWTGHKDHKVMELYYKIIAPHKAREMKKFNQYEAN